MRFFLISLFAAAVTAAVTPNMDAGLENIEARDLEGRATCTGGSVFCCTTITSDKKCGNGRSWLFLFDDGGLRPGS